MKAENRSLANKLQIYENNLKKEKERCVKLENDTPRKKAYSNYKLPYTSLSFFTSPTMLSGSTGIAPF